MLGKHDGLANDEDNGIDSTHDKEFQLVTSKVRNKMSKFNNKTRHKSSHSKCSL